jgi:hypothetical protein
MRRVGTARVRADAVEEGGGIDDDEVHGLGGADAGGAGVRAAQRDVHDPELVAWVALLHDHLTGAELGRRRLQRERFHARDRGLRSLARPDPTRTASANNSICREFRSGRQDLNLRPPGPQPGALPDCATPRGSPVESTTRFRTAASFDLSNRNERERATRIELVL